RPPHRNEDRFGLYPLAHSLWRTEGPVRRTWCVSLHNNCETGGMGPLSLDRHSSRVSLTGASRPVYARRRRPGGAAVVACPLAKWNDGSASCRESQLWRAPDVKVK